MVNGEARVAGFTTKIQAAASFSARPDLTMAGSGETVTCRIDLRICRHSWVAVAGLVVALCAAQPVHAEGGNADNQGAGKQEAKAHFKAGQTHYNLNEYVEALGEFKAAYRLFPDPVFLYNLAQCERRLGHYEEAISFYRSYLREHPQAPNRAEVQRRIEELEAAQSSKGGEAEQGGLVPPAAAEGKHGPSAAPPAEADPTAGHQETASASPSAEPTVSGVSDATAGLGATAESKPPSVLPVPAPAAADPTPLPALDLTSSPAPATGNQESSAFYGRWWFWTTVGVVAAGAGVGLYLMSGQGVAGPNTALGSRKVF